MHTEQVVHSQPGVHAALCDFVHSLPSAFACAVLSAQSPAMSRITNPYSSFKVQREVTFMPRVGGALQVRLLAMHCQPKKVIPQAEQTVLQLGVGKCPPYPFKS